MSDTTSPVSTNTSVPHRARSCVLHVCTSCRLPGTPREPREGRPGAMLYRELLELFRERRLDRHVAVKPVECLSLCRRPCGIALSSPGAWTYLFGDQHPAKNATAIVECVSLYLDTENGFMPRARRPKPFRASVLGRVPPLEVEV
ncbi:MAG: DUF1636 domain-containing protein [Pseudomonadota bacterium]